MPSPSTESLTSDSPSDGFWFASALTEDFRLCPGMLHELHIDQLEMMEVGPSFVDSKDPSHCETKITESCPVVEPKPNASSVPEELNESSDIQPTFSSESESSFKSGEIWEVSSLLTSLPQAVSEVCGSQHIENVKTPLGLKFRFKKIRKEPTVEKVPQARDLFGERSCFSPVVLLPRLKLSNLAEGTMKLSDPSLVDVQHPTRRKTGTCSKQCSTPRNNSESSMPNKRGSFERKKIESIKKMNLKKKSMKTSAPLELRSSQGNEDVTIPHVYPTRGAQKRSTNTICTSKAPKSVAVSQNGSKNSKPKKCVSLDHGKIKSKEKRNPEKKLGNARTQVHHELPFPKEEDRQILAVHSNGTTPDVENCTKTETSTRRSAVVKKRKSKTRKTSDDQDSDKSEVRCRRVLPRREKKKAVKYASCSPDDDCTNHRAPLPRKPRADVISAESSAPPIEVVSRKRGRPRKYFPAIPTSSTLSPTRPKDEPPKCLECELKEEIESASVIKENESPSKDAADTHIGSVIFLDSEGALPCDSLTVDPPSDPFKDVEPVADLELEPPEKPIPLLPIATRLVALTISSMNEAIQTETSTSGSSSDNKHQNSITPHIRSAFDALNSVPVCSASSHHTPLDRHLASLDSSKDNLPKVNSDSCRTPTPPLCMDLTKEDSPWRSDGVNSPDFLEDGYSSPCEYFHTAEPHDVSLTSSNVMDVDDQPPPGDFFTLSRDKEPPLAIPLNTEGDRVVAGLIRSSIDEYLGRSGFHMSELRFRRRNQWIGGWRKARYSDGSSVVTPKPF